MPVNILYRANASAAKPQSTSVNVGPLTNEQIDGNTRSIKDAIDSIETNYLPLSGGTLTGGVTLNADASADMQPVTYRQLQSMAAGLDVKASVKAATTANITLSGTQTIDGIAVAVDDRVLVKNQSSGNIKNNGIYVVKTGAWTRATDMDSWAKLPGAFVFVEQGDVNTDTGWVCTVNAGGTLNTTDITWTQFSGAGSFTAGTGISVSGTAVSVTAASAASLGGVKVGSGLAVDGSGTLSIVSAPTFNELTIVPTAGQTVFTISGGYTVGAIEVYLNGVMMYNGSAYTATNGTTITFSEAMSVDDTVLVRRWTSAGGLGTTYPVVNSNQTWDAASIANGAQVLQTFIVTGATLGDFVLASYQGDLQGLDVQAFVSAANTVKLKVRNDTGAAIDLVSGTWGFRLLKRDY